MRPMGFLTTVQRRIAWVAFLLLAIQTPIAAKALTDDSWTMSLAVAGLVAVVILADETYRGQKVRRDTPPADNA